ncbi:MAG: hypothetical protein U0105_21885 [Candidatus Obscuribacterales bacterium]
MSTTQESFKPKGVIDNDNDELEQQLAQSLPASIDVIDLWKQFQDKVYCATQLPGDKTGGKTGDPVEALAKSDDETNQRAAERLKALVASDSEADKQDAARLTKMLTNEKDRALAISLLTNVQDDAVRHQFFAIVDDPKQAVAAKKLTELLVTPADKQIDAPQNVAALLTKLTSDDKDQQADGKQLLAMLNDPAKQADAAKLLQVFYFDAESMHTALSMINHPSKAKDVAEIMSMLKSDKGDDVSAAMALIRMNGESGKDATVAADRQALMAMLRDPKTRGAAIAVLANLDSPQHVHQMLELLKDPAQKRAADRLLSMLHHEDGQLPDRAAQQLLDLLTNPFVPEKGDGARLLKLFNSEKAEERESAEKLLRAVGDAEHRHELLKFIEDPQMRPGVDRLLDLASSPRRREREKWEDVYCKLDGTGSAEDKIGRQIVALLAGDEKQQAIAKTIVTRTQSDQEQSRLLDLLAEPKTKEAGQKLLEWLQGDDTQRSAAMRFLNLNVTSVESGFNLGRRQEQPTIREPHAVVEQLLPMLTDKDKAATAMTLLTEVSSPAQIKMVIDGLAKADTKAGCEQVLKMLGSKDHAEQRAAKELLAMIEPPIEARSEFRALAVGGRARKEGEWDYQGIKLLTMLGDPKQTATAKQILSLDDRFARTKLQDMLQSYSMKETGERILKLMAEKGSTGTAEYMLSKLSETELKVALDLMDQAKSDAKAPGVGAFNYMMRDKNDAAVQVAKLLGSVSPEEKKFGQQMLEKLSGRERWDTQTQLTLGLSAKPLQQFQALMADHSTRAAAYALQNMLQSDHRRLVDSAKDLMYAITYYKDSSKDALYVFKMLNPSNKEAQALATALLTASAEGQEIARMGKALQDPAERKSAEALIKLLNQPLGDDIFGRVPAKALLRTLAYDGSKIEDPAAAKLFRMLGDEKKAPLAETLLTNLPSFEQQKACLAMIEPRPSATREQQELSKTLSALALSKDRKDTLALARLMELKDSRSFGSFPPAVSQELEKMLSDPDKRADGLAILSRFENARQCSDFVQMLQDKKTEAAAKAMLSVLKSPHSEDSQGVVEVLKRIDDAKRFSSARSGAEALPGQTEQLLKALSDPATADNAKKALQLVQDGDSMDAVVGMLATAEGRADLAKLTDMRTKDNEQKRLASGIAALRSTAEIHHVLQMLQDEKQRDAAKELVELANNDDDRIGARAARRVLQLLTHPSEAERKAGEQLLSMMRSDDKRELARLLGSSLRSESLRAILDVFADPSKQYAAAEIEDLLKDQDNGDQQAVERLATMLASVGEPTLVKEGQRLLAMLNDSSSKYTALRILRRGRGVFSGN